VRKYPQPDEDLLFQSSQRGVPHTVLSRVDPEDQPSLGMLIRAQRLMGTRFLEAFPERTQPDVPVSGGRRYERFHSIIDDPRWLEGRILRIRWWRPGLSHRREAGDVNEAGLFLACAELLT